VTTTAPLRNLRPLVSGELFKLGDVVEKPEGLTYVDNSEFGVAYHTSIHLRCYRRIEDAEQ
jgi:hypothetical protein